MNENGYVKLPIERYDELIEHERVMNEILEEKAKEASRAVFNKIREAVLNNQSEVKENAE